ncbi:MAG: Holliday junction branch migration protein RuvA [Bacteroidaceae bacterium]|nr:Holliday junction branch migration protein RuvA [Bacteroidaceae bacterium]MBR5148554.1 Holliday junction branch migration protein RuvA [Bacteroidaceae bacterium]
MIEYLKGDITELTPTTATIECHGVGYLANISLNTYTAIQNRPQTKLYIYEGIREDAYILYGFADKRERELFMQLISVSGIGGNTARTILSALNPNELCEVIASGNDKLLKMVKGIGGKTAQRIIVELKDKIGTIDSNSQETSLGNALFADTTSEVLDSAVAALTMLGYTAAASQKVVKSIIKEQPTVSVEAAIKEALRRL